MKLNDWGFNAVATCSCCDKIDRVVVTCGEIKRFICGLEHVQTIWPDLSPDERETLIGWRSQRYNNERGGQGGPTVGKTMGSVGFHMCGDCWDKQLGEEI